VATVVLKLFNIVRPTHAYFGQKDAQQAIIICRLVRDLDLEVKIRVLPIVRDSDGLALSSRNVYLCKEERAAALHLPQALHIAAELIQQGESVTQTLRAAISAHLQRSPLLRIDYVAIVRLSDLADIERIEPRDTLIACAIYAGKTRLIDNMIMGDISC
jgi:pantoate--beta-alanine ligase